MSEKPDPTVAALEADVAADAAFEALHQNLLGVLAASAPHPGTAIAALLNVAMSLAVQFKAIPTAPPDEIAVLDELLLVHSDVVAQVARATPETVETVADRFRQRPPLMAS